jgi:hypothetical protein
MNNGPSTASVFGADELVATYVLQVNLVHRQGRQAVLGSFNLWKKGGWFGKADEMLKFCTAGGCVGFVSDTFYLTPAEARILGDLVGNVEKWPPHLKHKYDNWYTQPTVCPVCGNVEIRERLADSYGFNMTIDRVVNRICHFFDALGRDADLFLVRTKEHNAFQKARAELYSTNMNRGRYDRLVGDARNRETVLYTLKKIIKDTADSGTPEGCFRALVTA